MNCSLCGCAPAFLQRDEVQVDAGGSVQRGVPGRMGAAMWAALVPQFSQISVPGAGHRQRAAMLPGEPSLLQQMGKKCA